MAFNVGYNYNYIEKIHIFENETHFLFLGKMILKKEYILFSIRKLFFKKNQIKQLNSIPLCELNTENKRIFSKDELNSYLKEIEKKSPMKCNELNNLGIFGFIKFFLGYYIILINNIKSIGKINKHTIYRIENLRYIPLFFSKDIKGEKDYELELQYLDIFKSMDCLNQMYFSYTYNITKTIQRNFIEEFKNEICTSNKGIINENERIEENPLKKVTNNYFLWNYSHLKEIYKCLTNKSWFIYIIYGFFCQNSCEIYGLRFLITVIARRNRNYAGTRYLKRGINNDGNAANDVETEQILEEISTSCSDLPIISSFVHIRGSVPIFWHQDQTSILPKPDIKLNYSDIKFDSTKRHFEQIILRYGKPCLVCNLTKKNEKKKKQETLLNEWYKKSIDYINKDLNEDEKILYYHYDLKTLRKDPKFYKKYCDESCKLIAKTNLFCFIPHDLKTNTYMLSLQNGVIRSNCIDCLDRTNVYQQIIGTAVMLIQLRFFSIESVEPESEYDEIYGILTEIYKQMGNVLSSQYGGSLAHKQTIKDQKKNKIEKFFGKFYEFVNTTKRYLNNTLNDQGKQNAYNLFLGKYKVDRNKNQVQIWDMVNDVDLHRKFHLRDLDVNWAKNAMNFYIEHNLLCDIYDKVNLIHTITSKKELFELGNEINLDVIQKIHLNKYNKILPVLTYSKKSDIIDLVKNSFINTYDYLLRLDRYLSYKRLHPTQYIDELLYINETPIFNLLNIDFKTQIKSFETFNYENTDSKTYNFINSKNDSNAIIVFDESFQKGININNNNTNKKIELKEMKENNNLNSYLNDNNYICSFSLEKNINSKLKKFCNFNINELTKENNSFTIFDPLENLNEFNYYIPSKEYFKYQENNKEFIEDFKSKSNTLDIINRLNNKNEFDEDEELDSYLWKDWSNVEIEKNDKTTKISIAEVSINFPIKLDDDYIK